MKTYNTFEEAFVDTIKHIIANPDNISDSRNGKMYEKLGYGFKVKRSESYIFENQKFGRIDYSYAEDFYNWMMNNSNGLTNEEFATKYPHAKGFLEKPKSDNLPENFNTLYGPRVQRQLPRIIKELSEKKNSRRSVLSILNEDDLQLLDAKDDPNLEFPCADSATFNVRDGVLYMHLHMRSNNMGNVAKIDMYLWGKTMEYIAFELGVTMGEVTYTIVSAHVFSSDFRYFANSGILSKTYQASELDVTIKALSSLTKSSFENVKVNQLMAVRHARTENNINRIYQGGKLTASIDIVYDANLQNCLDSMDEHLEFIKSLDIVFCSKYIRTSSTAIAIYNRYIAPKMSDIKFPELIELNEFNLGSKDGQEMDSSISNLTSLVQYLDKYQINGHLKYNQHGESIVELFTRIYLFIDELESYTDDHDSGKNILISGHGLWLAGLDILLGKQTSFAKAKVANMFMYKLK